VYGTVGVVFGDDGGNDDDRTGDDDGGADDDGGDADDRGADDGANSGGADTMGWPRTTTRSRPRRGCR